MADPDPEMGGGGGGGGGGFGGNRSQKIFFSAFSGLSFILS